MTDATMVQLASTTLTPEKTIPEGCDGEKEGSQMKLYR